jgi:hypothetical protein
VISASGRENVTDRPDLIAPAASRAGALHDAITVILSASNLKGEHP